MTRLVEVRLPEAHARRTLPTIVRCSTSCATTARCISGPLGSNKQAMRIAEAIETAMPLRRCTAKPTKILPRRTVRGSPARRRNVSVLGSDQPRRLHAHRRHGRAGSHERARTAAGSTSAADARAGRGRTIRGGRRHARACSRARARAQAATTPGHTGARRAARRRGPWSWRRRAGARPTRSSLAGRPVLAAVVARSRRHVRLDHPRGPRARPPGTEASGRRAAMRGQLARRACATVRIVHCDEGLASRLPVVASFTPTKPTKA